jgi:hypothetical protein
MRPDLSVGDALPERTQPLQPMFARIGGDNRGIDGSDGDPGNPGRLDIGFVQRLIA